MSVSKYFGVFTSLIFTCIFFFEYPGVCSCLINPFKIVKCFKEEALSCPVLSILHGKKFLNSCMFTF